MGKTKKRYGTEKKFLILREAAEQGVVKTCRKHGVDPTTYYSWKEKYEANGMAGLLSKKSGPQVSRKELRKLRKENGVLKKLLAEKEVMVEAQKDLLKKKNRQTKKRGLL